jgi:hypothetical protein
MTLLHTEVPPQLSLDSPVFWHFAVLLASKEKKLRRIQPGKT